MVDKAYYRAYLLTKLICRSVLNVSMFSYVFKLLLTNYVDIFKPMVHLMLKPDFTCNVYAPFSFLFFFCR